MGEWGEKEEHCALTSLPLHLFTSSPFHQILKFYTLRISASLSLSVESIVEIKPSVTF